MWIDEYVQLMFPENVNDIDTEKAMTLKYENIPSSLYKYRAFNDYSIDNLRRDEVWFNPASNFNDPYDCALTINQTEYLEENLKSAMLKALPSIIEKFIKEEIPEDELKNLEQKQFVDVFKYILSLDKNLQGRSKEISEFAEAVIELIEEEHNKQVQSMTEKMQQGMLISCFSEIHDSILMWSHYANNHTGFCLEYNFKKQGVDSVLTRLLQPVIYSDQMFDMTNYLKQALKNRYNFNNLISTYAAIVKSTEWSYEKEWRIVLPLGEGKGFNRPFFQPEAVYLGTRMSRENKETIINIAKQKQISVYQMKMKSNEFKLVAEKIL
ncbi:DUF2971 domain-containing protein [Anoxybacillus kestanbolensis]|uniref:DUF2971 domain-containing protein n=1 Tax=Anoxybacillus kestanbolensis TaxID=227476 RepID=UPI003D1B5D78